MCRRVSALGVAALVVVLAAGTARAELVVSIASPSGGPYASPLPIAVNVVSTFDVASVHAQVGAIGVDLAPAGLPTWAALLPIDALPYGPATVVVTATDVFGATATAQVSFVHDELPAIAIAGPVANAVARPTLSLAATCTDDTPGGCTALTVAAGPMLLASGTSAVAAIVDLAALDGQTVTLRFAAQDATGRQTVVTRRVYVEVSPDLVEVATLGTLVLDVDDTRILYADAAGAVHLHRRGDGLDQVIGAIQSRGDIDPIGHLTSAGAAWVSMLGADGSCAQARELFEWRGAGLATLVDRRCAGVEPPWTFAGDHAALLSGGAGGDVVRRDLTTGATVAFSFPQGSIGTTLLPFAGTWLAPGGDVVGGAVDVVAPPAVPGVRFYRHRAGTLTELGHSLDASAWGVMSDGERVLYLLGNAFAARVALLAPPAAEQVLTEPLADLQPGRGYAIAGGWVAFLRASATTGARQVWRRSPAGLEIPIAPFATDSTIDLLAPSGDLTAINAGTRYLGAAGGPPLHVGSALGRPLFLADGLHIVLGRTVLRYHPAAPPTDAGVDAPTDAPTDAGVDAPLDAGVDALADAGADASSLDAALDAPPDAPPLDAPSDALAIDTLSPDASLDPPLTDGGCTCTSTRHSPRTTAGLALFLLAALTRRRRRRG